jgi:hypothetical protein
MAHTPTARGIAKVLFAATGKVWPNIELFQSLQGDES